MGRLIAQSCRKLPGAADQIPFVDPICVVRCRVLAATACWKPRDGAAARHSFERGKTEAFELAQRYECSRLSENRRRLFLTLSVDRHPRNVSQIGSEFAKTLPDERRLPPPFPRHVGDLQSLRFRMKERPVDITRNVRTPLETEYVTNEVRNRERRAQNVIAPGSPVGHAREPAIDCIQTLAVNDSVLDLCRNLVGEAVILRQHEDIVAFGTEISVDPLHCGIAPKPPRSERAAAMQHVRVKALFAQQLDGAPAHPDPARWRLPIPCEVKDPSAGHQFATVTRTLALWSTMTSAGATRWR